MIRCVQYLKQLKGKQKWIVMFQESRVVRCGLVALAKGGTVYPKGSLFMDCQAMEMDQLVALAQRRGAWNALAKQLR